MSKLVCFTDLDGTLLDDATYSFDPASEALEKLREQDIPLVICSSKTRKEIEHYREKLRNTHPFISENGGGIFIPEDYFGSRSLSSGEVVEDGYAVIRLGASYPDLRNALSALRKKGFGIRGFGDMTAKEVSDVTGLSLVEAEMAKERDFDEPFLFPGGEKERENLVSAIIDMGFTYTQGQFYHILGESDKGRAVLILAGLYRKKFGAIVTVGLGDSPNDIPMLEKVDYPVIVQKPDGSYRIDLEQPNARKTDGPGPWGWNSAILQLLSEQSR